jgi:hypothetical protein
MAGQGRVTSLIDEAHFHGKEGFAATLSKTDRFHGKVIGLLISLG